MVEGSKIVKELGRILKILSYLQVKEKLPNHRKLDLHGRCLIFEEFSLKRKRAVKEKEDIIKVHEEMKQKKLEIAKNKIKEKI